MTNEAHQHPAPRGASRPSRPARVLPALAVGTVALGLVAAGVVSLTTVLYLGAIGGMLFMHLGGGHGMHGG